MRPSEGERVPERAFGATEITTGSVDGSFHPMKLRENPDLAAGVRRRSSIGEARRRRIRITARRVTFGKGRQQDRQADGLLTGALRVERRSHAVEAALPVAAREHDVSPAKVAHRRDRGRVSETRLGRRGGKPVHVAEVEVDEAPEQRRGALIVRPTALDTGDTTRLTCGNGVVDPGEDCDLGTSFGGATCASASGGALDYGTLACNADCSFDTSGCQLCPGEVVGGHCWVYGAMGADCDVACSAFGLVYDEATWLYAGSSGTNAQCAAVLDALGVPAGAISTSGPAGSGCCYVSSRFRSIRTTYSVVGWERPTGVRLSLMRRPL